jgi:2-amino-4-hydroxy-6-hydroxymethyldihydropteridine diphosphokinase/dihydroneopterin aldolase/2-amino-4-hydroxy-6-hydroxymethyldihydropteridine diphosphokinase
MSVRAVVALGGNLGDRHATLDEAVRRLNDHEYVDVVAVSTYLDTVALRVEGPDELAPRYLNAVAIVETSLDVTAFHAELQHIETALGRERRERWGDRTLDLDLIDFDGQVISTETLVLPHPRAHERLFVLDPWFEIDPQATIPGIGSVDHARKVRS